MIINIYKKPYEEDFSITVEDRNTGEEINLGQALKETGFNIQQTALIDTILHKIVNREVTYK